MRAMNNRQVIASVRYQDALREIEAARPHQLYVVRSKSTGVVLSKPLPKITAEHFARTYGDGYEAVAAA